MFNLKLTKSVAIDVLSMTGGESLNESIFYIPSHVIKYDRAFLSPEVLSSTTFIMNNKRASGIDY